MAKSAKARPLVIKAVDLVLPVSDAMENNGKANDEAEPEPDEETPLLQLTEQVAGLQVELAAAGLQGRDSATSIARLEADAADNNGAWEDGAQIAEDLADQLEARPLEV